VQCKAKTVHCCPLLFAATLLNQIINKIDMKASIGISDKNSQKVVMELAKLLATEYVLYTKTKTAHWNMEGIDFYEKHKLFDEQGNQLLNTIDNIAERIRSLDQYVQSSLHNFLELSILKENVITNNDGKTFMKELLLGHETIILELRKNITVFAEEFGDYGSSDFITGLLQEHEKTAWILRTHLK
jgi:starvation-inducible DNA-binding protein